MIVKYTPADGEPRSWSFNPRRQLASMCGVIEAAYRKLQPGGTYAGWAEAALAGDIAACRVLLWHLQKAEHPVLRLEDVDFYVDELEVAADAVELRALREQVVAVPLKPGMSEADRDEVLAKLDEELAELEAAEGKAL